MIAQNPWWFCVLPSEEHMYIDDGTMIQALLEFRYSNHMYTAT